MSTRTCVCVCVCKLTNVCMYVCTGMYMHVVLVEVRKLCQISWSHSYRQRAALDAGSTLASSAKRGPLLSTEPSL